MDATKLVSEARAYLLSFDGVTPQILDAHLFEWKNAKRSTIPQLFRSMIGHAQNRQGMPNSIGNIDNLAPLLFDFDPIAVLAAYPDYRALLEALKASGIKVPGRIEVDNRRGFWVIYARAILSCAGFMSSFKSAAAFHQFVDGFNFNEHSKLALPLLLEQEIFGFGFALACDFLKENGYPQFVKPDVHINEITRALGISRSSSDYGVFKDTIAYCDANALVPYEFDKLLWHVGSGRFYQNDLIVPVRRQAFIDRMLAIA